MDSANASQFDVPSAGTDVGLGGHQSAGSFEFLTNRIGSLGTVRTPPRFRNPDLAGRNFTDLDMKQPAHSRARSSPKRSDIGMVSRRSNCSIARSKICSVSASTSNVSSASRAMTVTVAPSGNALSSSTRPPMTFPDAICMKTFYQRGRRCPPSHRRAQRLRRLHGSRRSAAPIDRPTSSGRAVRDPEDDQR